MSKELVIQQGTTHLITSLNSIKNPSELPMIISERESSLAIKDVFKYSLIVNLETPKKQVIKTIRSVLMNTAKQFHWSKDMGIQEATTLSIDLYEALKTETLEDIILMFNYVRKGMLKDKKTGSPIKLKGRIDNETLFNLIIPSYLDLKAQEREEKYLNKKHKIEEEEKEELTKEQTEMKKKLAALSKKLKLENALKRSPDMKRRHLQEKANEGKASSEEILELEELTTETKKLSPINELCQEHFAEYDRLKKDEPEKIPKRITNSYDYLKLQLSKIKVEDNTITDETMREWANDFFNLREQGKLPKGIDTYSKFFEWKNF